MKNFESVLKKLRNEKATVHRLSVNIKNKDYKGILVEGELINNLKEVIGKEGFNIYGLRHNESDWTESVELTMRKCLVNSMGFFITKETFIYEGEDFYIDRSCYI